jgi:hypothetical protein
MNIGTLFLKRQLSQGGFVAERARDILAKSSEDEPRDDHGRWTSGGGNSLQTPTEGRAFSGSARGKDIRAGDSIKDVYGTTHVVTSVSTDEKGNVTATHDGGFTRFGPNDEVNINRPGTVATSFYQQ